MFVAINARALAVAALCIGLPIRAAAGPSAEASTLFALKASASSVEQSRQALQGSDLYAGLRGLAYLVQHAPANAVGELEAARAATEPLIRFQALRLLGDRYTDVTTRANYCHRYLARTPTIAALGSEEFSVASVANGALRLQNAGLIQVVARSPLNVTRADGTPLSRIAFSLDWMLDGKGDGVAIYDAPGDERRLTFVRSRGVIDLREVD